MVSEHIEARGVRNERVLNAMRQVPRHLFVPEHLRSCAYDDCPQIIGYGQSISQPYIVALMTDLLGLTGIEKVLDVGTGSGYQAAVLSLLVDRVVSIERVAELAETARQRLEELGYRNVTVHVGDGSLGWPDEAPYDAIVVAAGSLAIPPPLIEQLAPGGRLVIPIGDAGMQDLIRVTKNEDGTTKQESFGPVVFVPLVGQHGWPPSRRA